MSVVSTSSTSSSLLLLGLPSAQASVPFRGRQSANPPVHHLLFRRQGGASTAATCHTPPAVILTACQSPKSSTQEQCPSLAARRPFIPIFSAPPSASTVRNLHISASPSLHNPANFHPTIAPSHPPPPPSSLCGHLVSNYLTRGVSVISKPLAIFSSWAGPIVLPTSPRLASLRLGNLPSLACTSIHPIHTRNGRQHKTGSRNYCQY